MNNVATPAVQRRNAAQTVSRISSAQIDMDTSCLNPTPLPGPRFGREIPYEPLVALYRNHQMLNTYDLFIIAYIPKGVTGVWVDHEINDVGPMLTEAGEMSPRIINIHYTNPPTCIEPLEYEQYHYFIRYTVDGPEAPAVCVQYVIGDPRTTRGTVTVVRLS